MIGARLRSYVRGLLSRSRFETEITDELQFHIQARADDLSRQHGLSHEEAVRKARIEFGSIEKYKDEVRESRGFGFVGALAKDIHYAVRILLKQPGVSAII